MRGGTMIDAHMQGYVDTLCKVAGIHPVQAAKAFWAAFRGAPAAPKVPGLWSSGRKLRFSKAQLRQMTNPKRPEGPVSRKPKGPVSRKPKGPVSRKPSAPDMDFTAAKPKAPPPPETRSAPRGWIGPTAAIGAGIGLGAGGKHYYDDLQRKRQAEELGHGSYHVQNS